tara:strand:+ start:94 stop:471 length:378 start_codon:yes stop_codon:yes gene_type:complete
MHKKIHYHDTDCGGVVYYANYLKYFEEARTEFMLNRGVDLRELSKDNILFAVKNVDVEYRAPARYGDDLLIRTEITRVKNASLEFSQSAQKDDKILVAAKTKVVCIDNSFRPKVIPQEVNECLNK